MSITSTGASTSASTSASGSWIATLVGRRIFWIGAIALLFAYPIVSALRRTIPKPPPVLAEVPDFTLRDQLGRDFGGAQLRGKPWVADFIFTRCGTVCPKLTGRMEEVQHRARNLGGAFHMVSFTVDPEHDTPEVLADYARKHHASPRLWSFLTGERSAIEKTVIGGLKVGMGNGGEPAAGTLNHDSHFVLVDDRMHVRGYYAAEEKGEIDRLMKDLGLVVAEQARGGRLRN